MWLGAGISFNNPTRLPLGDELTAFTVKQIFFNADILFDIWTKITKIINIKTIQTKYPRLESILASCAFIEKNIDDKSTFLSGFKAFNEMLFNTTHFLVASMVKYGANVMTANFDLCVENAYEYYFQEKLVKKQLTDGSIFYETLNGSKIVHFHGTTDRLFDMKMTLDNLMSGLPGTIMDLFNIYLETGKLNIFLGYSFSDEYDVNPILKKYYQSHITGAFNIVCHHDKMNENLEKKVKNIFKNENILNISANTEDFMKCIFAYYGRTDRIKCNIPNVKKNWSVEFLKYTNITDNLRFFISVDILNKIKIDIKKIEPNFEKILRDNIHHINWECQNIINYELCTISKQYYLNNKKTVKDNKSFIIRNYSFEKSQKRNVGILQLDEIMHHLDNGLIVTYEETVAISYYHKEILSAILRRETINKVFFMKFIDVLKKLRNVELKFIPGMVVYASALRYSIIIDALTGGFYEKNFIEALSIYYDFGNIEGIISTYIEKIFADYVRLSISCKDNVCFRKALEISSLIGAYKYLDELLYLEKNLYIE